MHSGYQGSRRPNRTNKFPPYHYGEVTEGYAKAGGKSYAGKFAVCSYSS